MSILKSTFSMFDTGLGEICMAILSKAFNVAVFMGE